MGKVLGVVSLKGGVGKTTVSAALASSLANHYEKKVLLVDANYSAPNLGLHMDIVQPDKTIHDVLTDNVPMKRAIHNKFGVDVIPGNYNFNNPISYLKLRDKLANIKKCYDFVILDSSPNLNEEMLSVILASDNLFVVSTPDYPTLSCSLKAAQVAKQRGREITGIIVNKIREPNYELRLEEIEDATGIRVIGMIPDDSSSTRALFMRVPLSVYNKRCDFSREIDKISRALTGTDSKWNFLRRLIPKQFRREEINREMLKESFYNSIFSEKKAGDK